MKSRSTDVKTHCVILHSQMARGTQKINIKELLCRSHFCYLPRTFSTSSKAFFICTALFFRLPNGSDCHYHKYADVFYSVTQAISDIWRTHSDKHNCQQLKTQNEDSVHLGTQHNKHLPQWNPWSPKRYFKILQEYDRLCDGLSYLVGISCRNKICLDKKLIQMILAQHAKYTVLYFP